MTSSHFDPDTEFEFILYELFIIVMIVRMILLILKIIGLIHIPWLLIVLPELFAIIGTISMMAYGFVLIWKDERKNDE